MPASPFFLVAILLGPLGPASHAPELPALADVRVEADAYAEPDVASVPPGRLRAGTTVRVVDADPATGWLTIEPPEGSFSWVRKTAVEVVGNGLARVTAKRALVRTGIASARMPGPPRAQLDAGTMVRLLDQPPLVMGTTPKETTWLAIAPTKGEVRYVRADRIAIRDPKTEPSEIRASYEAEGPRPPVELAREIASAEAEHKAELNRPIESWRLDAVRARYQDLLRKATDPESTASLQAHLDRVSQQEEAARAARSFTTILERSRRRDQEVALATRRLAEAEHPARRPYVAEGLVRPSSRLVDGRRVYALIGPDGAPIAFLDIPPGLDPRAIVAKRAGVRGSVRYSEDLGARLIAVRDLEPLD